ncbi:MAG: hypothetical protein R2708_24780 [Vicinamibacterales bacterium]
MPCIDAITPRLAEARDVGRAQVLGVFDAPAPVLDVGMGLECGLEDVERLAVGAVADGVHAELCTPLAVGQFG